jgi:hypothetical protein
MGPNQTKTVVVAFTSRCPGIESLGGVGMNIARFYAYHLLFPPYYVVYYQKGTKCECQKLTNAQHVAGYVAIAVQHLCLSDLLFPCILLTHPP